MSLDRVSPQDLEAERAILGAILVNNDRLHDIGERIKSAISTGRRIKRFSR
jgi:replicative DNA helicase